MVVFFCDSSIRGLKPFCASGCHPTCLAISINLIKAFAGGSKELEEELPGRGYRLLTSSAIAVVVKEGRGTPELAWAHVEFGGRHTKVAAFH